MTDNTKYLLGYESVLIRTQSEIIAVLFEALKAIKDHDTLDGDKYNNHQDAYYGVVEFADNKLQKAESLAFLVQYLQRTI